MRSAYTVLGIPANASQQDIDEAWAKAQRFYTRERLASQDGAVDRFQEICEAHRVLSNAEMRSAHDRKLQAAARAAPVRTPVVLEEAPPAYAVWLKAGVILVALLFAAGIGLNWRNQQVREERAAQEAAARRQQEQEDARRREEAAAAEQQRARQRLEAEQAERRLANEARTAAMRAEAEARNREAADAAARRMAQADAQRAEAARRAEQQRLESDARRRVEQDRQRIRELCLQQYRRPDC